MPGWRLEHSYAQLPQLFYSDVRPTAVAEPRLVIFNRAVADDLGLDGVTLDSPAGAAIFGKNFKGLDPVMPAAGSMICGAVVLIPASLITEQPWTVTPSLDSIMALLALSVFSTALAFVIYFRLVQTLGSVGTTDASPLTTIDITLNAAALAAILADQGGVLFIGGIDSAENTAPCVLAPSNCIAGDFIGTVNDRDGTFNTVLTLVTAPAVADVPEPSSAALLLTAGLLGVVRRHGARRRGARAARRRLERRQPRHGRAVLGVERGLLPSERERVGPSGSDVRLRPAERGAARRRLGRAVIHGRT